MARVKKYGGVAILELALIFPHLPPPYPIISPLSPVQGPSPILNILFMIPFTTNIDNIFLLRFFLLSLSSFSCLCSLLCSFQ